MKKLMLAVACSLGMAFASQAEVSWDWWFNNAGKDIKGCALGIGSENKDVMGAQISVAASLADNVKNGAQGALGYSRVKTLRNGVQLGLVTQAESASLQFGLICFNKTGFLPVFPFLNIDTKMFGRER